MISSMVMWVAVTAGFSKPIPAACMYNMDDTTIFLEQKFKRNSKTYVSGKVKKDLRDKNLSFSFGLSKSKKDRKRKKMSNPQARTVKILLCTCADGTAVCTVIKIKDTAITEFKMEPLNPEAHIWLVWDPKIPKSANRQPAEPKAVRVQRTSCIMKNAILPAIVEDMTKKKRRQSASLQSFAQDGSCHSSQDSHAADECYDRGILSMDGDFSQIEAILADQILTSAFRDANVELFKFAAGASMTQQPNDRSRCFYCLKKALREQRMHIALHLDSTNVFICMKHRKVLRALGKHVPDKGASKGSFATFNFFLSTCDTVFGNAFTVGNIRGGWMKCGLAPFNPQVMMESYAFFTDLQAIDPTAHQQVLAAIPKLAVFARESGACTDAQMEAELGELFALSPAFAAMYNRPVAAHAPVNHRRCIWLSNPTFLETERRHRQEKIAEAAAAAVAAASRAPRGRKPSAAVLPSNPAPSVPASDVPWCFPCQWISASGAVIKCGSGDKKKPQHIRSGAHKNFLAAVEVARALPAAVAAAVADSAGVESEEPVADDDPLQTLDLNLMSRALDDSSNSNSECDSENEDEDAEETTGWFTRTRPLSHTHACCRWRHPSCHAQH